MTQDRKRRGEGLKAVWDRLGHFIGSHTAVLAPSSVAAGVLLAPILEPIRPIIPTLFAVMTFQSALRMSFDEVRAIGRHPFSIVAILAFTLVLMPVLSYGLAQLFFTGNEDVIIGTVIEFSSPIAVMCFIWIGMLGGNVVMALAVILVSSVVTPFTMPLTLSLLLGQSVEMDSVKIMLEMLYMVGIPAVLGLLVNDRSHGWGERVLAPKLFTPARIIFILVIATNSSVMVHYLSEISWTTLAIAIFILALCMLGFALGTLLAWLLKAPTSDRVSIGYTCGMKNISVGAVIAANYFNGTVVFTVIIAVMYQQVLAAIYRQLLTRFGVHALHD